MSSRFRWAVTAGLVVFLVFACEQARAQGREPAAAMSADERGTEETLAATSQGAPPIHPEDTSPSMLKAEGLTLEDLVDEALAKNPDLLALQDSVGAANERPEQARALPDPMVSLQYTNDAWKPTLGEREMTTLGLMASQTLPWPGKRALRAAVAAQDAIPAKERLARARLSIAAAVKRAYWGLALARETLLLLGEQEQAWQEAEGVARARYAVGQGAQPDVLRAQVEITRFEQERAQQEAERDVRVAELNRLLGREPQAPATETPRLSFEAKPRELAALWAKAEAKSPELRAAAAAEERERLAVTLARLEFRPDVTVQASYMNRGGLDPMWQAGLGVNLPSARTIADRPVRRIRAKRRVVVSSEHPHTRARSAMRGAARPVGRVSPVW
jgi:cobalt-zinc-cadmium efflux system outer membrane protein